MCYCTGRPLQKKTTRSFFSVQCLTAMIIFCKSGHSIITEQCPVPCLYLLFFHADSSEKCTTNYIKKEGFCSGSAQDFIAGCLLIPPMNIGRGIQCIKYFDYAYTQVYRITRISTSSRRYHQHYSDTVTILNTFLLIYLNFYSSDRRKMKSRNTACSTATQKHIQIKV